MDPAEIERMARHEDWYWWHRARRSIVQKTLQRHVGDGLRILDVGCGSGATTQILRRFGSVLAFDLEPAALRFARGRGLTVARSRAQPLPLRDRALDLVVALDVLEHLEDDRTAALEVLRVLSPGGLFLATVPAYPFLWSRHDEALHHKRRYTKPQLQHLLESAGFEILISSYFMLPAFPPAWILRILQRRSAPQDPREFDPYPAIPRWLDALLGGAIALEGHLVGRLPLPFGLSVLALARRPIAQQIARPTPVGTAAGQRRGTR